MIKAYIFVKRERLRKKIAIYRLLYSITFDIVTIFYLSLLAGYFIFSLIKVGELPTIVYEINWFIASIFNDQQRILWILLALPLLYTMRSFQRPGVLFSSAEWLLSILPYSRKSLWTISYFETLVKKILILVFVSNLLYIIAPITLNNMLFFIISFSLLVAVMTIVQWRLFRANIVWKLATFTLFSILNLLYVLSNHVILLTIYILVIIVFFIYAWKTLFTKVDWPKIVAASDFLIWNMPLVSQATKIKFKKDKQPPLLYRLTSWKEKFPYRIEYVYNRLWYIYFEKQIGPILQMSGALFLLLSVISYFGAIYYGIAIVSAMLIQTSFLLSLLRDRVTFDILSVLPWKIPILRKTFMNWAFLLSIILFIPIGMYAVEYFENLFIFYLIFVILAFYLLFMVKLDKQLKVLDGTVKYSEIEEIISYVPLLFVLVSVKFQWLLLGGYVIVGGIFFYRFRKENTNKKICKTV